MPCRTPTIGWVMILFTLGGILLSCSDGTHKAYAKGNSFTRVSTDKARQVEISNARCNCASEVNFCNMTVGYELG